VLPARDLFDEIQAQHKKGQREDSHGTTHERECSNLRAEEGGWDVLAWVS
jgi:hypothetical protein